MPSSKIVAGAQNSPNPSQALRPSNPAPSDVGSANSNSAIPLLHPIAGGIKSPKKRNAPADFDEHQTSPKRLDVSKGNVSLAGRPTPTTRHSPVLKVKPIKLNIPRCASSNPKVKSATRESEMSPLGPVCEVPTTSSEQSQCQTMNAPVVAKSNAIADAVFALPLPPRRRDKRVAPGTVLAVPKPQLLRPVNLDSVTTSRSPPKSSTLKNEDNLPETLGKRQSLSDNTRPAAKAVRTSVARRAPGADADRQLNFDLFKENDPTLQIEHSSVAEFPQVTESRRVAESPIVAESSRVSESQIVAELPAQTAPYSIERQPYYSCVEGLLRDLKAEQQISFECDDYDLEIIPPSPPPKENDILAPPSSESEEEDEEPPAPVVQQPTVPVYRAPYPLPEATARMLKKFMEPGPPIMREVVEDKFDRMIRNLPHRTAPATQPSADPQVRPAVGRPPKWTFSNDRKGAEEVAKSLRLKGRFSTSASPKKLFEALAREGELSIDILFRFARCPEITSLQLSKTYAPVLNARGAIIGGSRLSWTDMVAEIVLSEYRDLVVLDCTGIPITDAQARLAVAKPRLEQLCIGGTNLSSLGLRIFVQNSQLKESLISLSLEAQPTLTDEDLPVLITALPKLNILELGGCEELSFRGVCRVITKQLDIVSLPAHLQQEIFKRHMRYAAIYVQHDLARRPCDVERMTIEEISNDIQIHKSVYENLKTIDEKIDLRRLLHKIVALRQREEMLFVASHGHM